MRQVSCAQHGLTSEAFVCHHTLQTLEDDVARGFIWSKDSGGVLSAYCDECEVVLNKYGGEWNNESEAFAQVKLLCFVCAVEAAQINGVEISK